MDDGRHKIGNLVEVGSLMSVATATATEQAIIASLAFAECLRQSRNGSVFNGQLVPQNIV